MRWHRWATRRGARGARIEVAPELRFSARKARGLDQEKSREKANFFHQISNSEKFAPVILQLERLRSDKTRGEPYDVNRNHMVPLKSCAWSLFEILRHFSKFFVESGGPTSGLDAHEVSNPGATSYGSP
eukprot:SAG22_NODE_1251_length_5005_cov_22.891154_5_plen_129_part_00